jgi:hypothetical protein
MLEGRSLAGRVLEDIIDALYPLVSFRKHRETGKIHLFPSKLEDGECEAYKESFCSRRKKNPVKKKDTEGLSSQRLEFRGRKFIYEF